MPTDKTRPMDSGDGKLFRKSFTEDGRGETKPIPEVKSGARYIYYRLYTKDGPLESNHPIYSNDRFISRIASTLVRPPQTAASLTRYLCKIEGLNHRSGVLYQSLSDTAALDDATRLLFRGTSGPGPSDVDPVALIVDTRSAEKRSPASSSAESQELLEWKFQQHYVYYRIYDDDGGTVPKTAFAENNPSLGRLNTLSVPPPHAVSSLKNCIMKVEDPSGNNVQLFEDESSESAMNDSDAITVLSDTFPGWMEDQPIAITYDSGTTIGSADNENPPDIQIRELREALAQSIKELEEANRTHARELAEVREGWNIAKETHEREINEALSTIHQLQEQLEVRSDFPKKIKTTTTLDDGMKDAKWHSIKPGEIFYTDGISRQETFAGGSYLNACYLAMNSFGKQAFVDARDYNMHLATLFLTRTLSY
ncbi:uncharacterized protein LACBIDRAFT_301924 [Laccaria bicolor S238N-H82]|uniref:Predicted protein n=1 Tax=Laccaria bicolor (strain S238N-H82 / ATCC MYA-4686) TaxID=486041 RepID=B0CPX8_LACBS|nr:uncharacterized protein LACBIDRAFT_301924 [Laccaria bicolor S238N-H82]EDR15490.1 predicted protein [Laccaria bicolor S238N-H82]|eukprot:XP_001873698.1 predicted protein [Laccaria bicolor S238N-H82]